MPYLFLAHLPTFLCPPSFLSSLPSFHRFSFPSFLLLFLPFFSSCFVHSEILVWEIHCLFPSLTPQLISSCMLPLCPARADTLVYVPFLDPVGLWAILCLSFILSGLLGSLSAVRWMSQTLTSAGYMLDLLNLPKEYIGWKPSRDDWEIQDISPSFSALVCSPVGVLFSLWLQLSHLDDLWPWFVSASWFWPYCFCSDGVTSCC